MKSIVCSPRSLSKTLVGGIVRCARPGQRQFTGRPEPFDLATNRELFTIESRDLATPDRSGLFRNIRDWPIAKLFATGQINSDQYDAVLAYAHDLDAANGRLRAPHRDDLDVSVWVPRASDCTGAAITGREDTIIFSIRESKQSQARLAAAKAALSDFMTDLRTLRVAFNRLIVEYFKHQHTPRELQYDQGHD